MCERGENKSGNVKNKNGKIKNAKLSKPTRIPPARLSVNTHVRPFGNRAEKSRTSLLVVFGREPIGRQTDPSGGPISVVFLWSTFRACRP